ncbi:tyrosine-type recombinase/integrase [Ruegeria arenilitoris]|uniref:tyrosine-type recombinase/integrase n=1 Tax=Ruegeria arenilitoris TaxID=1173585 RepID=UPI00147C726F|nr:site-specific integrase [Ruegeria arenilitoris]
MAALYKRKLEERTVYRVVGKSVSGKRKEKTFRSRSEAKKCLASLIRAEERGENWVEQKSFLELANEYMQASAVGRDGKRPLEISTLHAYKHYLDAFILPMIGDIPIGDLNRDKLIELIILLKGKCKSVKTAEHALNLVKAILNWGVDRDLISKHCARNLSVQPNTRGPKKTPGTFSDDEMRRIYASLRCLCTYGSQRDIDRWRAYAPLVLLLATTGVRISEALGLRWEDFSEDYSHVSISRRVDTLRRGMTQEDRVGDLKTTNSYRRLAIVPELRELLVFKLRTSQSPWVFASKSGYPKHYHSVRNHCWVPLLEHAGVDHRGFHSLRHYVASSVMLEGKYLEAFKMLGHHTASFTMTQYGHVIDDGSDRFSEISNDLLDKFREQRSEAVL